MKTDKFILSLLASLLIVPISYADTLIEDDQTLDSLYVKDNYTVTGKLTLESNAEYGFDGPEIKKNAVLSAKQLHVTGSGGLTALGGSTIKTDEFWSDTDIMFGSGAILTSYTEGTTASFTLAEGGGIDIVGATLNADVTLSGGSIAIADSPGKTTTIESLTATSGTISVGTDSALTFNGSVTLDNVTLTLKSQSSIDLNNNVLSLGENVVITLEVGSLDNLTGNYKLFENVSAGSSGLDNLSVTFTDGTNTTTVMTTYRNGSVTVVIPEPATAALSLLALVGLATRRRRASL